MMDRWHDLRRRTMPGGWISVLINRRSAAWTLLLVFVLYAGRLAAQTAENEMPMSPGDKMLILYYEDASSSVEPVSVDVIVDQQGKIFMPMLGEVTASGKTSAQLEKELVAAYSEFVEHPLVSVRIEFQQARVAYLLGAVNQQGAYQVESGTTLSRFLSEHGGVSPNADLTSVWLLRGEKKRMAVNVANIFESNNPKDDIVIEAGDRIFIPIRGSSSLDRAARLMQVLTMVLQAALFVVVLTR
ncbi:MAG: polysaccharide biosynthesis/export family protein [bacterium]